MYNTTKPYTKNLLEIIKDTWKTPYLSVQGDLYPTIKKNFDYEEIDHTDGIGTKGIYHWKKRTFKNAVIDALAMNLNDLAVVNAIPYKIQNHIMIPKEDKKAIISIISALAEECKKYNIAITGGETSIHNNLEGLEISITASGFIKQQLHNTLQIGDKLIGIKSSGLHSNGFTKVRDTFFSDSYRKEFTEPTKIYLERILELNDKFDIHGRMHITGGAFTKLKKILKDSDAIIKRKHDLKPQKIFYDMHELGVSDKDMYQTLNCGVGFILGASKKDAEKIVGIFKDSEIIGEIKAGSGKVKIESNFSNKKITL
jgi:phosphoribosylformylglycinamidine cyclo-ligase